MPTSDAEYDVIVIGAGILGLQTARRLVDEGKSVLVFDKQDGVGGIWSQSGFANSTSRPQNHEPAYRVGYNAAVEDYTSRDNLLLEIEKAANKANLTNRVRLNTQVVRVIDLAENSAVKVLYHSGKEATLHEASADQVIFCTGTLQRPRQLLLAGEESFGGPVEDGVRSLAEKFDFKGKSVVIVGMGAFALDSARMALFRGAHHVHMVARRRNTIVTRFARVAMLTSTTEFSRNCDRERRQMPPPQPMDPAPLYLHAYLSTPGAETAMPRKWLRDLKAGRRANVWQADGPTPWATSDVFFIGLALGRLSVHVGEVHHLEPHTVVVHRGGKITRRLKASIVIKNVGFESPDQKELLGSVCEVIGADSVRPPIWVSPRTFVFRHETEVAPMSDQDWQFGGELFNYVGSSTFGCNVWLEVYLHFRDRPEELRKLFNRHDVPRTTVAKMTRLDISRGLHAALSSAPDLNERVQQRRRRVNEETLIRYSPPGTPAWQRPRAWVLGFLEENRTDWEDICHRLTGDSQAVPYIWDSILFQARAGEWPVQAPHITVPAELLMPQRPVLHSAL